MSTPHRSDEPHVIVLTGMEYAALLDTHVRATCDKLGDLCDRLEALGRPSPDLETLADTLLSVSQPNKRDPTTRMTGLLAGLQVARIRHDLGAIEDSLRDLDGIAADDARTGLRLVAEDLAALDALGIEPEVLL